MSKNLTYYGALALIGLFLLWGGYVVGRGSSQSALTAGSSDCHRTFDLMDQNLDCEAIEDAKERVGELEDVVNTFTVSSRRREVERISVFYRDLNTRRWFGVDADDQYYPASLAKLPLAITYYKVADLEPTIFDQPLVLKASEQYSNKGQKVSVDSPMVLGQSYSIRRMVDDMLVYSDNRPIGPLLSFMREDVWKKVYADLGIRKQSSTGEEEWSVSPRTISLIFRSLYNGSYLDLESSQEILGIMTKARYADGIAAGVPHNIRIAHKFGEATMVNEDGSHTPVLHDCGIVYKPGEPYILCVMTEGKDFKVLEERIAEISKMVYEAQ